MNTRRYLGRIGESLGPDTPRDLDLLQELQRSHLLTIPFESLDIARGEPITLDLSSLYAKVIDRERGGFCYELNSLFGWLLRQLGYSVRIVEGQVRDSDGNFGPPFDHMALLVTLDQQYLVDVGFGDFCREPLPISGDQRSDLSGTYKVASGESSGHCLAMEMNDDDEWVPAYRFTTTERELDDFVEMCEYQQSSPESAFTDRTVCTIATRTGRATLSDGSLIITENDRKRTENIDSQQERERVLDDLFGVTF
jgi:N-hydroxyarylamine O-acetyltransferase